MPRYFLNTQRKGVLIRDEEGDALADPAAAETLVAEILRDMVRLPHVYGHPRHWRRDVFVITDETGAVVVEIPYASVL